MKTGQHARAHPHEETITAMNPRDVEIYGTDTHGTVVTTDGVSYSVQDSNEDT